MCKPFFWVLWGFSDVLGHATHVKSRSRSLRVLSEDRISPKSKPQCLKSCQQAPCMLLFQPVRPAFLLVSGRCPACWRGIQIEFVFLSGRNVTASVRPLAYAFPVTERAEHARGRIGGRIGTPCWMYAQGFACPHPEAIGHVALIDWLARCQFFALNFLPATLYVVFFCWLTQVSGNSNLISCLYFQYKLIGSRQSMNSP